MPTSEECRAPTAGGRGRPLRGTRGGRGLVAGCITGEWDPILSFSVAFSCDLGKHISQDLLHGPWCPSRPPVGSGVGRGLWGPDRVRRAGLSSEAEDLGAGKLNVQVTKCHLGWEPLVQRAPSLVGHRLGGHRAPSRRRQTFPAVSRVPAA